MKQVIWIITTLIATLASGAKAQEQIHLYPDRTSCVSGDTVWFNAVTSGTGDNTGSIIHVQLDDLGNNHITKVSVASAQNSAAGYLVVPDSLSTGIYMLKTFANHQKQDTSAVFFSRFLVVYNRFDENISEFSIPEIPRNQEFSDNGLSIIETVATNAQKTINVQINTDKNLRTEALEMIVTARLFDPFADQFTPEIQSGFEPSGQALFMPVRETNGILVTGRVLEKETENPVKNTPVLLSIADTFPYFDYCVSDDQGRFFFYIRNAVGKGDIVLQEVSEKASDNTVELRENFIETTEPATTHQVLTLQQKTFASALVKAAYFDRIFSGYRALSADSFSIRNEFKYPFYGSPTFTFYPDLFIDLPNFKEISREILHGVQYREKKDEVSIRLFNNGNRSVFSTEPLKLLDGIPVFDAKRFSKLNTQNIQKIDAVYFKRYFGDISFDGVLAVYTKNPSLGWVESVPELKVFRHTFIQVPLQEKTNKQMLPNTHIPDFRTVLFRERWNEISASKSFSFERSDIKGDLLIEVIVVGKNKRIIQRRKIIHLD